MIRYIVPLLLPWLVLFSASAHTPATLAGRITDTAGKPIPYANIGLLHRDRGTVSAPDGDFRFTVDSLAPNDTLRISCIGYVSRTITGNSLTESQFIEVELPEKIEDIAEIVVLAGEERIRRFGHEFRKSGITASFRPGQEGGEAGVVCRLKGRQAQLREARITLLRSTDVDSLHLRLNCYALRGDEVGENLCHRPILVSVPAIESRTVITVDLSPYNLWVADDFLFSVENLTPMGVSGQYWFAAGLAGNCMSRYTSQSPWKHQFFGVGIQVDVATRE